MARPVVCVLKGKDGKGEMRLAVNYRYVNRHTVADAYPLSDRIKLNQIIYLDKQIQKH